MRPLILHRDIMSSPITRRHLLTTAFNADNPGRWAFHCHNLYHMITGMMAEFRMRVSPCSCVRCGAGLAGKHAMVSTVSVRQSVLMMMRWAKSTTVAILCALRNSFELIDRIVDYCIDSECTQEQSTDLWPEYDLGTRELRRARAILNGTHSK